MRKLFIIILIGISTLCSVVEVMADYWTITKPMNTVREYHTATLLPNGQILITGGCGDNTIFSSSELYDPITGVWTITKESMSAARYDHTATLLPNGQVLVTGGQNDNNTSLSSSELYDPTTGIWTPTKGSMSAARYGHTAALLPNGQVLVAGGISSNKPSSSSLDLSSSELYDPTAGVWTATNGSMNTARACHSATLLPNSQVLVAGGIGGIVNYNVISNSEFYDHTTGIWTPTKGPMNTARYGHLSLKHI